MAYERINWQNEPSEATALNDVNLNKMDSAIYDHDQRLDDVETDIDNKVDKVTGQGLSKTNDVQVSSSTNVGTEIATVQIFPSTGGVSGVQIKNGVVVDDALSSSSENPVQNKVVKSAIDGKSTVAISDTLATGTTLANITIDGTTTAIKGSDIEVDEELSPTSTNPVENKAIYDALNNLLPSKTVSGNPIAISDASGFNAKALTVTMNPIQDLHGYPNPWAGGAGKNKLPLTVDSIKSLNSGGWTGNKKTINNVDFTILTDDDGNVTGINVKGTASGAISFALSDNSSKTFDVNLKMNGVPSGLSGISLRLTHSDGQVIAGSGEDTTITAGTYSNATFVIYILSGTALTAGVDVKPMIRLSTVTDATFEPYSNICPISGRTEASVKRTGKNQCDTSAFNGVTHYTVNTDGSITVNSSDTRSWSSVTEIPLKAGTYTVSKSGTTGTSDIRLSTEEFNTGHIFTTSFTFTLATDGSVKIKLAYGGITYPQTYTLQIESGSTATAYEPYNGETITIQFGQTVYGGSLDLNSGVLTIDRAYKTVGNITNWGYTSGKFYSADTLGMLKTTGKTIISDTYKAVDNIAGSGVTMDDFSVCCISVSSGLDRIYITDSRYSDETTFKTAMSSVQLCFILATPIIIQLTAEEVALLKGNNVLSTNADDMELKYSVSLDSLLPATTRTLAKSVAPIEEEPIVEEPKEETDETEER